MDTLWHDFRFALRLMWRDRGFSLTTILTLAICIGANTALFTVVRSVLLRPLPYPGSDRLVNVYDSFPGAGVDRAGTSVPNYFDRLSQTDVFAEQALYSFRGMNVGEGESAERVRAMAGTPSLLRMLEVEPALGRIFTQDEGEVGNTSRVILSYGFWQRQFGSDRAAVGKTLRLNGEPYTVVGVMPKAFAFLDPDVQLWIPLAFTPEERAEDHRYDPNNEEIARLKPGASVEQAQEEIDAFNQRLIDQAGQLKPLLVNVGYHTVVVPMQQDLVRSARGVLYLLWGGVLFVLLIAAVNVTNLVLVRASGRMRELATRTALGAGRWRLARQLLTETTLLALVGGALGLVLGGWSLGSLSSLGLAELPRGHEIHMDGSVVAFTAGLALALGFVIGLVPVAQLAGTSVTAVLREDSRTGTAGRGARLLRRTLVTAQVAIAFVLLIGAGLLLASFELMLEIDPGFKPAHVLTGFVNPPATRYPGGDALRAFVDRTLQRIRALPGVTAAGATTGLPFGGGNSSSVVLAEGYVMKPGESVISPNRIDATPGYFEAMGIPLLRGRYFDASDAADAPNAIIVDERLAKKFWPDSDPIGRRMYRPGSPDEVLKPGPDTRWYHVVGVVGSVKQQGLVDGEGARLGTFYLAYAQTPGRGIAFAVRTAGDPLQAAGVVRRAIAAVDPELPFYDVRPMAERVERSLTRRRTPMMLSLGFAVAALMLAAIGIYGVLAYQVSQRAREIGIRMALGSDAPRIFRMILGEGAVIVAVGLGAGLVGTFGLRRLIVSQLYGITPLDPAVIGLVGVILGIVALVASAVPAIRASRIDPAEALNRA
jgi:predicted permease